MISNEQLLMQIDKHLKHARISGSEQSVRESLVAIKALCDVALDAEVQPQAPITSSVAMTPQVLHTQPAVLKEEDANGDSLFDF